MTAYGAAGAVADADVDMATAGGYGAGEANNLEVACAGATVWLVSKTDIIISKAACAGADPACFYLLCCYKLLDFFFQILAGLKTNGMCFYWLHILFLLA